MELSRHLDDYYRAGGSGDFGAILDMTKNWRLHILGRYAKFPLGHESDYFKLSIDQRYSISQNMEFRIELDKMNENNEWMFGENYYF